MSWHAFNWNGEYVTEATKGELLDRVAPMRSRVRRYCAGTYEVTTLNGRMWWIFSSLSAAEAQGFIARRADQGLPTDESR